MKELKFDCNYRTQWQNFKEQYHEIFWDELHSNILKDVKEAIEQQVEEEFEEQIGAKKYERSNHRKAERLGKRYRSLETKYGFIQGIEIPRARNFRVTFTIFDKWQRIQKKVLQAMLHAYLHGRSSKSASKIVEEFGNSRYSRSFFQKLTKQLENKMKKWLERPIEKEYAYVFIDGMGIRIRDGHMKDSVVVFAIGMNEELKTELLGYVVGITESEETVRGLLIDLKNRGLKMPKLFISDGGGGIISALNLEYPHVMQQRCAFHKMKNINENLNSKENRKDILSDASLIYEQSKNKKEALIMMEKFRRKWLRKEEKATRCFCKDFEKTLRYFKFPKEHWKSIYTSNPVESFISQIRSWINKFNYFEGKTNLNIALFSYFYTKFGDTVLNMNSVATTKKNKIPTLFVA